MNDELFKAISDAFPDAFLLAVKILPIALFIPVTSSFIHFLSDCATDRRNYNRSLHVARREQYKQLPHVPTDCEKWVKEFEEREDISIYG